MVNYLGGNNGKHLKKGKFSEYHREYLEGNGFSRSRDRSDEIGVPFTYQESFYNWFFYSGSEIR